MRRIALSVCLLVVIASSAGALPPLFTTSVSLSVSPSQVTYPASTRVSGRLLEKDGSGLAGKSIEIDSHRDSSQTWVKVKSLTTDTNGGFTWTVRPSASSVFRASFAGNLIYGSSASRVMSVAVTPTLSLIADKVVGLNQAAVLRGAVTPILSHESVTISTVSNGKARAWKSAKITANGSWSLTTSFASLGDRTFRASLAKTKDHLSVTTRNATLRVTTAFATIVGTGGQPRIQSASIPGSQGCSTGLARIIAANTRGELHPGYKDPEGTWRTPTSITTANRPGVVAAFNSGFELKDSRGGFRLEDSEPYALRSGAATIAFNQDGSWQLGSWDNELSDSTAIVAVRQNLELLVDNSKVASTVDSDIESRWGQTYKAATSTWRSGLGIDPAGNLLFIEGSCLSPRDVAQALVDAGAVRAMELDVNIYWPAFDFFTAANTRTSSINPHRLLGTEYNPADHYFRPSERDFFVIRSR